MLFCEFKFWHLHIFVCARKVKIEKGWEEALTKVNYIPRQRKFVAEAREAAWPYNHETHDVFLSGASAAKGPTTTASTTTTMRKRGLRATEAKLTRGREQKMSSCHVT